MATSSAKPKKPVEARQNVVILFAGDSGDGIQLTGSQFTDTNALFGNDVSTFPNFPYPWAVSFTQLQPQSPEAGLFLARIGFFVATSVVAYVYAWRKGVFRWD